MVRYYPLLLDLRGRKCLVVGGGKVAQRKARSLLKAGASVWIISPNLTKGLEKLKTSKRVFYIKSGYQKKYLKDAMLVIAATYDGKINSEIAEDAKNLKVLANVVDSPAMSNFIVPSSLSKGDLLISISTNGKAPGLSKRIRKDLSRLLIPRYAKFLSLLEKLREDLKQRCLEPRLRGLIMNCLVNAKIKTRQAKKKDSRK